MESLNGVEDEEEDGDNDAHIEDAIHWSAGPPPILLLSTRGQCRVCVARVAPPSNLCERI